MIGLFVCLFLEKKKVQDMIKRLAVSQVTKAGGKVLKTHRSEKSMTHMMRRRRKNRTEKKDRGNLASKN